jgi:hypothetical protein
MAAATGQQSPLPTMTFLLHAGEWQWISPPFAQITGLDYSMQSVGARDGSNAIAGQPKVISGVFLIAEGDFQNARYTGFGHFAYVTPCSCVSGPECILQCCCCRVKQSRSLGLGY